MSEKKDQELMSLYDPGAQMAMANTAEELGRRYRITRKEADRFALRSRRRSPRAAFVTGLKTVAPK